jgi:hypothetical protein|tara:strand:- start:797 stop:928 length:132 start_codon:yes stop_codon:yes gene_type:complete
MVRKWSGKDLSHALSDTKPGEVQSYELVGVTFPKGAKNALMAK